MKLKLLLTKLKYFFLNEKRDYKSLLRNVPASIVTLLVVSVVLMNLLANKEIHTGVSWLALDCGLLLSWLSFLCMDIITKRFGAKPAIKLSLFAISVNLFICLILFGISKIPGNWGAYYSYNDGVVNSALNDTIGGTWYILLGSTIAMAVASIVNSVTNVFIGNLLKKDNYHTYAARTYISTLLGQFVDNMIFALLVSHTFFGWSLIQCVTCSLSGCLFELLCEIIFTPIGYKISKQWEKENVGAGYWMKNTPKSNNTVTIQLSKDRSGGGTKTTWEQEQ